MLNGLKSIWEVPKWDIASNSDPTRPAQKVARSVAWMIISLLGPMNLLVLGPG